MLTATMVAPTIDTSLMMLTEPALLNQDAPLILPTEPAPVIVMTEETQRQRSNEQNWAVDFVSGV